MLAGVTRIIEVSFIVPKYLPEASPIDGDAHSDHTLAPEGSVTKEDSGMSGMIAAWGRAFRHLPAFVRHYHFLLVHLVDIKPCSCLSALGRFLVPWVKNVTNVRSVCCSCPVQMKNWSSCMIKGWIMSLTSSSCSGLRYFCILYTVRLINCRHCSLAFLLYTLIISLINLYATSGYNASPAGGRDIFEMAATATKWYSRVPGTPIDAELEMSTHHVIGDED